MASPSATASPSESVPIPNPSLNPNPFSNPNSSPYTSLTIQNIGSMVPIKLKQSNYLPWCTLFAPILRRYRLLGIVDGTEPCPSPLMPDRTLNSAFEVWYEKDQNLLIWFNSTLSEEVNPFTVGVSSSRDLWLKLEQRFGGIFDAHVHQLRSRLQSIQKGSQSMSDYLQELKEISDSLTAARAPISDRDLIAAILAGLPDDFESFTDSIMLRLSSTYLDELHGLLLTKELSMIRRKKVASSNLTEPFHALSQSFWYNSNRGKPNRLSNNRGNRGNYRGNNFTSNFNRTTTAAHSRGSSSGPRALCQIYGNSSHEAIDCYDRMNPKISSRIPPTKLQAMCARYNAKSPPTWLIDSGVTSHITNDISNIHSPAPYNGEEKVYIGDGKGLSISHVGSSTFCTPATSFKLNNVLHVPHMKHNLLSAFQFLRDNYCSLTLDSNGSVVKDRSTGKMLLRGSVEDGFYLLQSSTSNRSFSSNVPPSLPASAFVSIKATVKIWHSRLGHPFSPIFRKVLARNKLDVQGTSSVEFFCSDCAIAKHHKLPFKTASSSASHNLALLHCDVWGPAPVLSVSSFRYYLLIVDDHTKYSWFFPLKAKSEVYSTFVTFKTYVENTDILHEMMQFGAFGAKLSWNVVYVNGARGMNVVEGQRSSRNEEMKRRVLKRSYNSSFELLECLGVSLISKA
ncbi:hypothetical protein D8674_019896 [Pyrus ussuriensis x Pyrus communis]|uniref:Uncharacterized protein n=1 Tax=Pyrus ussuriensis x Pyrus communis TaxID=2448454 RepID=A0A5N5GM46_9ROSA|nr:hypothetical protein D8674_019896 [Pyrus ussuriensis x Pyrus communis]